MASFFPNTAFFLAARFRLRIQPVIEHSRSLTTASPSKPAVLLNLPHTCSNGLLLRDGTGSC